MIDIRHKLTPHNYTAMQNKKNEYIVIHYVGAVSSAENNAKYYANNILQASAHYFVDEDSIWQSVEDYNKAWHCGGGIQGSGGHSLYQKCTNSNSIGVEMCCKKTLSGKWYFENNTIKNTVDLVKYLMSKYNISVDRVIRHYDVTGKRCPEPYIDETAWADFRNMIKIKDEKKIMKFKDIENHYAKKHIEKLAEYGIVNGDGNGNFSPDKSITRADAAIMIANALSVLGK